MLVPTVAVVALVGWAVFSQRLRSRPAAPASRPPPAMTSRSADQQVEVRDFVRRQVRDGFTPLDGIVASAPEMFEDGEPEAIRTLAATALREELALLETEQRGWPAETDCDRLDRAFAELERAGVVARQNFTCCQTCGHAEIGDEGDKLKAPGGRIRGYTFYHSQDTESAVEGQSLYGSSRRRTCRPALPPRWSRQRRPAPSPRASYSAR